MKTEIKFRPEWVPAEEAAIMNSPEFESWYASEAAAHVRGHNLNNKSQREAVLSLFGRRELAQGEEMTKREINAAVRAADFELLLESPARIERKRGHKYFERTLI